MRVFNCEEWAALASFATDAGRFVGVAIGPESDEAVVRIDGALLQAGHPLTVRSDGRGYHAERVGGAVAAIARLQLVAFECLEELASFSRGRPPGRYKGSADLTALGGWQRLVTIPFVGRRQARFQIVCPAASVDIRVYGIAYNQGARAEKETLLDELLSQTPDDDDTVSFYVGGTNEAEVWDALAIDLTPATDQTCSVDATTVGEL